jgi:hypothetical protein
VQHRYNANNTKKYVEIQKAKGEEPYDLRPPHTSKHIVEFTHNGTENDEAANDA